MATDEKTPGLLDRLGHFFTKSFYGKKMKKHQKQIDSLFEEESKQKWDAFADKTKDTSFVKAVKNDPRSSDKLKLHTDSMHKLHTGKPVATIKGKSGKSYSIINLGTGTLGCTCGDWRYKGSVSPGYQCKHIKTHLRNK